MYYYHLFGQTLASELECPELIAAEPVENSDIQFRYGMAAAVDNPVHIRDRIQLGPGVYRLTMENVATYRIEGGRSIEVAPCPGAAAGDVRLYLLGTAMAALLHQQQRVPLHVCAVAIKGEAHAFCGPSGAGKSTLAAALHRRGVPLLCDDVGVAVPQEGGQVMFYPGFPRIKLWKDALEHFGINEAGLVPDLTRFQKYHLAICEKFQSTPLPLGRLYQLARSADGEVSSIKKLEGLRPIALLTRNTYRPGMVSAMGQDAGHFQKCSLIAAAIRTFRFNRPWQFTEMDAGLDVLLDHLHGDLS